MFVSKYVEEELPATIEDYDPDAENVVFTAQVSFYSYCCSLLN